MLIVVVRMNRKCEYLLDNFVEFHKKCQDATILFCMSLFLTVNCYTTTTKVILEKQNHSLSLPLLFNSNKLMIVVSIAKVCEITQIKKILLP